MKIILYIITIITVLTAFCYMSIEIIDICVLMDKTIDVEIFKLSMLKLPFLISGVVGCIYNIKIILDSI